MRRLIVVGLVAVLGTLATDVGAAPPPNVRGTVMRGPIMPVCIEGKACDAHAPGVVLVFSQKGTHVKRVTSGIGGRFALRLPPGVYEVRSTKASTLGNVFVPVRFRVPKSGVATLRLQIDTGIR